MTAAAPEESPVPPLPRKEAAEGIFACLSQGLLFDRVDAVVRFG